jgi:hypothetical protein
LREEHRLKVFEKKVLRRMFGLKRDEVIGGWRQFHDKELHYFYPLTGIIKTYKVKEDETGRSCSTHWEKKNAYRISVEKPVGKIPPRKNRGRIILKQILDRMFLTDLAKDWDEDVGLL